MEVKGENSREHLEIFLRREISCVEDSRDGSRIREGEGSRKY